MFVKVPDKQADRHIVLMEADDLHPTENHEIFLVGYPGETNVYEVGDTPGVRGKIAAGELVEVSGAESKAALARAERERQGAERAEQKRLEDERAAAEKAAAEAAKGAK